MLEGALLSKASKSAQPVHVGGSGGMLTQENFENWCSETPYESISSAVLYLSLYNKLG